MTNTRSIEPDPDTIVQDLHRIRESIVDSFGGDLHRLTADARERQIRSGKVIWKGKALANSMHRAAGDTEVRNRTSAVG